MFMKKNATLGIFLLITILAGCRSDNNSNSAPESELEPTPKVELTPELEMFYDVTLEAVDHQGNAQASFHLEWKLNTDEGNTLQPHHFRLEGSYGSIVGSDGGLPGSRVLFDFISKNARSFDFHVPLHLFQPNPNKNIQFQLHAVDSEGKILASTDALDTPESAESRQLISYLKADESLKEELFGYSTAISADGSLLVTSAIHFSEEQDSQGAVYTFERDDNFIWKQVDKLTEAIPRSDGQFGRKLQLSDDGQILAVMSQTFKFHLFKREKDGWESFNTFSHPYNWRDTFLYRNPLALSANGKRLAAKTLEGIAVYAIDITAEEGSEVQYLQTLSPEFTGADADPEFPVKYLYESKFGSGLAFSQNGKVLAVGAPRDWIDPGDLEYTVSGPDNIDYGAAFIFRETANGAWEQAVYLKSSDSNYGQNFGYTVALSNNGRVLAVGAPREVGSGTGVTATPPVELDYDFIYAGATYVYREPVEAEKKNPWTGYDDNNMPGKPTYIKSLTTQQGERFGNTIQLSKDGGILAIGGPYNNGGAVGVGGPIEDQSKVSSGAAFMYLYNSLSGSWEIGNYIKASNTDPRDFFGYNLSLSADGQTLVVGAPFENGDTDGTGGTSQDNNDADRAGAVYVY
ncbi:FG-GAP repeat protein [Microbulbifer sp. 2205BS26-8]|uniref:FG-GAP repeat protein n=1 Tax=Microbulbifer sp. 2205BS26-8 TaxID=3064386 RepID=UPI00273DF337|nr:FG-GAP repeat protein [Microbulbifer sp. 2205BS26-8]MDP5211094.1 hypothetical protein [Microbulbifer sp. 2205BS26-8]